MSRSRRAASWGLAAASLLLTLMVVGVVGELLVRHRERTRETVPGSMPGLFYRHERLRFALVQDFDYYGWVHVNDEGFRGPAVAVEKAPGVLRVMVVGASTVFDSAVTDDDRAWPARLEVWLECLTGRAVEVINAGVPGYVMMDNLVRLQMHLYRFDPDLLVLYQAHNDLIAALHGIHESYEASDTPRRVNAVTPWEDWLGTHSLLYNKVMVRLRAFQRREQAEDVAEGEEAIPGGGYDGRVAAGVARHEKDLRSFLRIADSFGIPVVVPEVVYVGAGSAVAEAPELGALWMNAIGAPAEEIMEGYALYEDVTRLVVAEEGAAYLPTVASGMGNRGLYTPGDPVHFNDAGADRMAEVVARSLAESEVVAGVEGTGVESGGPRVDALCPSDAGA